MVAPKQTQVDSFTEFVKRSEPRLKQALGARYGPELGRDAAAEALAYAWEHWERLEAMDNPAGYLYQVGRSRARRSLRRAPVLPDVATDHWPWVEPALPKALRKLTSNQRTAALLIHGFGWTHAEVAELMGVSLGTVQKHVERALAKLRSELGGDV